MKKIHIVTNTANRDQSPAEQIYIPTIDGSFFEPLNKFIITNIINIAKFIPYFFHYK